MEIRQATNIDLRGIELTHIECFPDSFSTKLGENNHLLEKLYLEYMKKNPELFLVAIDDNQIIGFCMGYYCEKNDYQKLFLLHNFLEISATMCCLLLKGEKKAWEKLHKKNNDNKKLIDKSVDKYLLSEKGDILSICVLPKYRGKNVSGELIENYKNILRERKRKVCILTVEKNNARGIKFYEKHYFKPYKTSEKSITYACVL